MAATPRAKPRRAVAQKPPTRSTDGAASRLLPVVQAAPRPGRRAAHDGIDGAQRNHYIEVAAYFIAERRGFAAGDPLRDWLAAEAQVARLIDEGKLGA